MFRCLCIVSGKFCFFSVFFVFSSLWNTHPLCTDMQGVFRTVTLTVCSSKAGMGCARERRIQMVPGDDLGKNASLGKANDLEQNTIHNWGSV